VKLALCLALSIPGCAVLGAFVTAFLRVPAPWLGLASGVPVGLFFGLLYADVLPRRWADAILGPRADGSEMNEDRPVCQPFPGVLAIPPVLPLLPRPARRGARRA
jgi:hypothetical protein